MDRILSAFPICGDAVSCQEYGNGHINRTYKIDTNTGAAYILQRINKTVFLAPMKLMENIAAVTRFLQAKDHRPHSTLHFLQTHSGQYCYVDDAGEYWRMYEFVPGFGLDAPESDSDFYESALAFGKFQNLLSDFPAETLHETIPDFHNTPHRFRQLKAAIAADPMGRAADVQEEIACAMAFEPLAGTLQKMRERGELPLRVTHNDTKLNNVILDSQTRKSVCVIDLDTVMPGLSAYDFGDSIRFGAASCAEGEADTARMSLDLNRFEVYTRGYLQAVPSLTDMEVKMLPMGALIMTLEVGIRFLADYINGDVYFRVSQPDQNLIRARNQLCLAVDMHKKTQDMERIVAEVAAQVRP